MKDYFEPVYDGISPAKKIIQKYYGKQTAKRSGVPLINHIYEGVSILENRLESSEDTIDAYCIHPILQSDDAFIDNLSFDFSGVTSKSIILAMEYRRVANSYLSKNSLEDFVGFPCSEIREMLIADKIQNYKDFCQYHKATHERTFELDKYFKAWFYLLEVDPDDFIDFKTFTLI
ncbi:MAG: hypothetical protein KA234_00520 [Saprospiraceae bacterium]|nr:hypothetical protein [Saprospiraceae bacterium]